ncbi:MAG: efflux RND transporter periplasmic adaptor subunit [Myxococcaceae bacterium]
MNKRSLIYVAVLLVLSGGGFALFKLRGNNGADLKFDTQKVDKGRIIAKVTATGTLSALVTVQVGSQVSGRIAELHADFNSQVKKGDVLARIDPQLIEAALEQARANYLAAQGNLTKAKVQALDAKRQFDRAKSLAERKLIAQADLETAQATAEAAQAGVDATNGQVAQSRASLHQAEVNLTYTTILSPIDGIVISRSVDVGQTVAASLQAPTLFVIAEDLKKMQVDTSVAEADVGKLSPGMTATFTVDAYPNQQFRGKVRQIRNAATTVQNVVTYDAVIDVENPELKLKPGMTANVSFIYDEKDDVVRVPNAALRFRPSAEVFAKMKEVRGGGANVQSAGGKGSGKWGGGGAGVGGAGKEEGPSNKKAVWILKPDGLPERVSVTTGTTDGSMTEIVEGQVKEGDQVVTDLLSSGDTSSASKQPAGAGGMRGGPRIF